MNLKLLLPRRLSWMIIYATLMHLWWAVAMWIWGLAPLDETGGVGWNVYVAFLGLLWWAPIMVAGSVMAIAGLYVRQSRTAIFLSLPQQAILTVAVIGLFANSFDVEPFAYFPITRVMRNAAEAVSALLCHTGAIIYLHKGHIS